MKALFRRCPVTLMTLFQRAPCLFLFLAVTTNTIKKLHQHQCSYASIHCVCLIQRTPYRHGEFTCTSEGSYYEVGRTSSALNDLHSGVLITCDEELKEEMLCHVLLDFFSTLPLMLSLLPMCGLAISQPGSVIRGRG